MRQGHKNQVELSRVCGTKWELGQAWPQVMLVVTCRSLKLFLHSEQMKLRRHKQWLLSDLMLQEVVGEFWNRVHIWVKHTSVYHCVHFQHLEWWLSITLLHPSPTAAWQNKLCHKLYCPVIQKYLKETTDQLTDQNACCSQLEHDLQIPVDTFAVSVVLGSFSLLLYETASCFYGIFFFLF